ncbi:MAG: HD domain-containing protein [Oscillospiraceae bacterium]|nr:HD domain-containing protein [Oscillospiraceae bacterium]
MNKSELKYGPSSRTRLLQLFLFCAIGILINRLGSLLAGVLPLPLYLDGLGTVLVASLGGYIPGIVVGYIINLINGISDGASAYYGVLSVMIAVVTVIMTERGWFRKPAGCVGAILIYAFIGGGLGSVLTWFLYGMGFGEGVSAGLAHMLHDAGLKSIFLSQFTADFLVDLLDKAIIVVLAATILHFIPEEWGRRMKVILWRQRPLSRDEQNEARHMRTRRSSLRTRIILLLSAALFIVVAVTLGICFALYHNATIENESYMAMGVANVAADAIDPDRVGDFMTRGHAAPDYDETEQRLISIRESSPDIEYVYAYLIREDGCHVIFDPDTPDTPGEEPGAVIPFDEGFLSMKDALLAGEKIDPIVTNDSYGWLLTVYQPLYDSTGRCVCYVGVDISMIDLINSESSFIAKAMSLFLSFAMLIVAIGIWVADSRLILPLNSMAIAAGKFAFGQDADEELNVEAIRSLDIHTGDEIENLYRAFTKTSEDMARYVKDVEEKNATITRMQDSLIMVLADMVESRDKHTGHHVKKTAAYARIIMEQLRREGIHTDVLTDEYIGNVVQSAPLHDVGKIEVPDALLNKPGKLTDEEYTQMKNHTLAGKKIIARSAEAVAESHYLDEAGRLAEFHHERWDGKGYPHGKKGEEIPLSARVMAVADVFDALVSKRSYKEGFPIEKALAIIKDGIGTQFDPQVAQAFLDAEEEVRRVAQEHSEHSCEDETSEAPGA